MLADRPNVRLAEAPIMTVRRLMGMASTPGASKAETMAPGVALARIMHHR